NARGAAVDRAEVELGVGADVFRESDGPSIGEGAGGGLEVFEWRNLDEELADGRTPCAPPGRGARRAPLQTLPQQAAPFFQVGHLRQRVERRRLGRLAGALVVEMTHARGGDVDDVAAY